MSSLPDSCSSSLLLSLPDDVFAMVSRFLLPRDICNLSLCCKSLCDLATSEKVWLTQCDMVGMLPHKDLVEWREGVSSYKALCRFLLSVQPLLGTWVYQNPELGNLVYVMPGYVSVVGCRVVPQGIGPLGIHDGPILWSSVFEVIGDFDGSAVFVLHGREEGVDYICQGSVKYIDKSCNVLLLEVEPLKGCSLGRQSGLEFLKKVFRPYIELSTPRGAVGNDDDGIQVPFSKLSFKDREMLLDITSIEVRQEVPKMAMGPLFTRSRDDFDNFQKDLVLLRERRVALIQMYRLGGIQIDNKENSSQEEVGRTQLQMEVIRKNLQCARFFSSPLLKEDHTQCIKRKSLWGSFKHIIGRSSSSGSHATSKLNLNREIEHAMLEDFLRSSDTLRLTLKASTVKLSSFRAWPHMDDTWCALYKMPLRVPAEDHVYAGLWGGTFGWPPGKHSEDESGKALFFVMLSYDEYPGQQLLIATKVLEGTYHVVHPNGSAMFIVSLNEPSSEPFPLDTDANSFSMDIQHAYTGEGIANGYGFNYPASQPGSLFVFQNGVLAFVWEDSRAVLTLQRLDLQELLKKGERIPSLPPINNFSYLTKSYSNVFIGSPST